MSKRAPGGERIENDRYFTPAKAVRPLAARLAPGTRFYEPCAGDGAIITHLATHNMFCVGARDIAPLGDFIERGDALALTEQDIGDAELLITNPPYERGLMHALIDHFSRLRPTWLLVEMDWLATLQAEPFLRFASDIIVVRRMKLFKGTPSEGYDNYVWIRFQREPATTVFRVRGVK